MEIVRAVLDQSRMAVYVTVVLEVFTVQHTARIGMV